MYTLKTIALMVQILCWIESGDNPAVKDNGSCVGVGHVKPVVVEEVNRLVGYEKWKDEDRRNQMKCKAIMFDYLRLKQQPDWTLKDVAIFYTKGSLEGTITPEQADYAQRFENLMHEEGWMNSNG